MPCGLMTLLREAFITHNPANLSADDLALVDSWKYRVVGDFYVFRYLKKHTVFLSNESPMRAYGVLGIVSPIEEILGPYLPILVQAVLLPFGDRIIYDSLLSSYSIYFGGGWRGSLKDAYRQIQEREGIITSLIPDAGARSPETVKKHVQGQNRKILTAFPEIIRTGRLKPQNDGRTYGQYRRFRKRILARPNAASSVTGHQPCACRGIFAEQAGSRECGKRQAIRALLA